MSKKVEMDITRVKALESYEATIQENGKRIGEGLLNIAVAIEKIKTGKLYKESGYKNMETYTKEHLGWGRTMMRGFITISVLAKDKAAKIENKGFVELLAIATEKKRLEKGKITELVEKKDNISTFLSSMWNDLNKLRPQEPEIVKSKRGIKKKTEIEKFKEEERTYGNGDIEGKGEL